MADLHVIYVAPFFLDTTLRFVRAIADLPGVTCSLLTQEPKHKLPADLHGRVKGYLQLDNALDTAQLTQGAQLLANRFGKPHRLLGTLEHIQKQLGEARENLAIAGMEAGAAGNFRDKAQMKDVLRAAGLPCARHASLTSDQDAWDFAKVVGFPQVIKPREGVGSAITFRVDHEEDLRGALQAVRPSPQRPAIAEEFVVGEEHSFEVACIHGQPVWHSLTRYAPTPLEVVRNPWIQWTVLLPRQIDVPAYDDVRAAGFAALTALGMGTGISHMEWFRRPDGSLAISEIASRPPGAQIMTLNSFAHDADLYRAWANLMVFEHFAPLERKYATGAAFFRGQGRGRVKRIHGLEKAQRDIGHLVVEARLPQIGQPQSPSYEGEGYAILRHPETAVVDNALRHLVATVRIELG